MTATTKRHPTLFRWSVQDGLGANGKLIARSYRSELEGVLTRTSTKWVADRNGLLVPRVVGTAPFAVIGGVEFLLGESNATNLALRSQELDHASWSNVGSPVVTANAAVAPDGTTTADTIADTNGAETRGRRQTFTVANDGTQYCLSVYVKKRTSAHTTGYVLLNARLQLGTGIDAYAVVDAFAGTILKSTAGDAVGIESVGGYWRVWLTLTNNTTGNTELLCSIYPGGVDTYTASTNAAGQGTETFWGVQLETGGAPSSYIPTTSATVTRASDTIYFPFTAVPQAMTCYVRGLERGSSRVASGRYLQISNAANAAPRLILLHSGGNLGITHDPDGSSVSSVGGGIPAINDLTEIRGTLNADGSVIAGVSINGSAESVAATSAADTLPTAWSAERLYLVGIGSGVGFGFTHICVAAGVKTLAEMRALAEAA